ncbi:hypothetical protein GH714_013579 [Hevea brasiliensis]|uniref:Uncharacterized protein n=1 Tax=Hevea brasiliensis TaxID=3981 RepID=A0A6A6KFL3_HEVBR|nr:hypothetical protein GH714_013579 [Hevea brasiliensis]
MADGESFSLSKLDFARILILTDSPTLVSRTLVVDSNYMRFQLMQWRSIVMIFFPCPIFKRKSHSPNISLEINSEDNNDNNDGVRDDLLGGDKHNSGDDNFNGKEDATSYNNSDGINHLKNELALMKDPMTRVLVDGSAPKVPSMHVEDSASSSKQCNHLNYEIGLTREEASETATSTSFPSADVTISV